MGLAPLKRTFGSLAILMGVFLCGCNQSHRPIANGYYLSRFDEGKTTYYLQKSGKSENGGGVFDGTVQEIGWNNDWVLARVTRLYRGDTNGWYALNLRTDQIAGPFPDAELKTNSALSSIKTRTPAAIF